MPFHPIARLLLAAALSLLAPSIAGAQEATIPRATLTAEQEAAVKTVSPQRLKQAIDFLAAPERGGRIPGSPGHDQARDWIEAQMKEIGLEPLGKDGRYLLPYPSKGDPDRFQRNADGTITPNQNDTGCDVIGLLRGTDPERAKEYVVYMGHYDHLGVSPDGKENFSGAFDDGGGVAVGLEVARVLKTTGVAPKRSIVFLITDDEENGERGARAWLQSPTVPLDHVVVAISGDPLGRRLLPDYGPIILSGLERSPDLLEFWRQTVGFADGDIAFIHRNIIPRFGSDQDEFFKFDPPIPAMWFINPGMTFYHKTTDTPETIDYRILADSSRYLARCLLLVGGSDKRFTYRGAPKMTTETAKDARVVLAGVLRSQAINDAERQTTEQMLATVDQAIAAGSLQAIENPRGFFTKAVLFLFQLSYMHPGEIPPPFPADVESGGKK